MDKQQILNRISQLLSRAPVPEKISSVQKTREFVRVVDAAKKAKSAAKALDALRQLEMFYQ